MPRGKKNNESEAQTIVIKIMPEGGKKTQVRSPKKREPVHHREKDTTTIEVCKCVRERITHEHEEDDD
eukprot:1785-Heterococcus_DN1.PRE.7